MSDDPLRVALIGCGRIADLQVLGYLDHPGVELHAVCDRDADLARRRREEWGARKAYTDVDAVLRDAEIEAVDVVLPHHLHRDVALAALRAGKHVSLQKPPTHTLAELDQISRVAGEAGRTLRVFENFQYYPPHVEAKELILAGAIGEPLSVRIKTAAGRLDDGWAVPASAQAWRVDPRTCGGGPTFFDHGYHCFNMGRFFVPEPVERVHAWIHVNPLGNGAYYDGPGLVSWKYAGVPKYGSWEVIASLGMRVRSRYYASDDRIEIHGTDGILWINRCSGKLLEEPALVLYRDGETRAWHDLPADWAESFRRGVHDFVDALRQGRQPAQSAADAAETLRFAIAAHVSAREGREVRLDEVSDDETAVLRADDGA
jgi:predicted dehydrogenase